METTKHEVSKMAVRIALDHISAAAVALCDASEWDSIVELCRVGEALQAGYGLAPGDSIRAPQSEEEK